METFSADQERIESAVIRQEKVLDEKWYEELEAVAAFQSFTYLEDSKQERNRQKKAFLNGEVRNPELRYPNIDLTRLAETEQKLLDLKKRILAEEENPTVRQLYRWKINEKLAEARLLRAAAEGDIFAFKNYSEFVYGRPSTEVFQHSLRMIQSQIEAVQSSDNEELKAAAQDLSDALHLSDQPIDERQEEPSNQTKAAEPIQLPQRELVGKVAENTRDKLQFLLGNQYEKIKIDAKNKVEYESEEVQAIFSGILDTLNATGWTAVVDKETGRAIFSMDQENKIAYIPDKKISAVRLLQLISHEIGIHLERRLNGERVFTPLKEAEDESINGEQPRNILKLLGIGLDRYTKGEEGLASAVEDSLKPSLKDFFGLDRHLAISLALGLDGTERDFRDVYEIMEKYYYFQQLRTGKSHEEALKNAQNAAWSNGIRTFRGTDYKTKGVCYTKDMLYREGNALTWRLLGENEENLTMVLHLLRRGKFDQLEARHVNALIELKVGITENDLKLLEAA